MAKKPLSRTLQLKPVQFTKQLPVGEQITLVDLMRSFAELCPTVGRRTWTQVIKLQDGTLSPQQCYFFNNYKELDEKTCSFEVWSYEPGTMPPTLKPDPSSQNAVIDSTQWDNEDESGRELIHISHVLVYGKAAIVEGTRGTGGVYFVQRYLNRLARDLGMGRHGNFYFTDAVSKSLSGEIDRGGGATGFTLGLSKAAANTKSSLLGMLTSVKNYMPQSGLVTVDWKSKDRLSTQSVVEAYDEAQQQEEIDSVIIHLKDGSSIRGLAKFKIKKNVEVEDIGGKNPNRDELLRKMIVYLGELCTTEGSRKRILDDFGALADNEIFIPTSRRSKKRGAE